MNILSFFLFLKIVLHMCFPINDKEKKVRIQVNLGLP